MDVLPRSDGWVCEGDKAPSFELPDSHLKPARPIEANTKVRGLLLAPLFLFHQSDDLVCAYVSQLGGWLLYPPVVLVAGVCSVHCCGVDDDTQKYHIIYAWA